VQLILANHSTYPRVGDGAHAQRLRRAYARRETGKLTDEGYADVAFDYAAEIIKEQEEAGVDLVTDGLVYWYDVVAHPASRLGGIDIRGIVRFFDTNTYVRQPEARSEITGTFGLAAEFARSNALASRPLKAVVTGPYTLARHTILKDAKDLPLVAKAYAEALGRELAALDADGATLVQIDEPSLLRFPEDAALVGELLEIASRSKGGLKTSLATYFGDATTIYGELLNMPVDMLGFDIVYGPKLVDAIVHDGDDRPIALGAIDGRNTKLDDTDTLARTLDRVLDTLQARGVAQVHLQPSCGLEFLPRDRAKRKLERMAEIRNAVAGASA
jgi:5-methyltetrahydropteroyltriglutamate--homocysteine methyltransferase